MSGPEYGFASSRSEILLGSMQFGRKIPQSQRYPPGSLRIELGRKYLHSHCLSAMQCKIPRDSALHSGVSAAKAAVDAKNMIVSKNNFIIFSF